MKKQCCLIFIMTCILGVVTIRAQVENKEIVLKTEVSEATVFINGAQIMRSKGIDLLPGRTRIRFTNLSPYIDAKSVQVKASGDVTVVSVNHQMNYLDSVRPGVKNISIDKQIDILWDKIKLEETNREIIKEELAFLEENKKIGGINNGVNFLQLKETAAYYKERLTALKTKDLELVKHIQELKDEKDKLINEQNQSGGIVKRTSIGEVIIEVESNRAARGNFDLLYYVSNAGWFPAYDIRAVNVNQPIELVYKANIRQNTQENWNNVKLKISSADPNQGSVAPKLKPYLLDYYISAPRYNTQVESGQVAGVILDAKTREALIGVSVMIKGTTIGTATDLDGRFSLSIPQNGKELTIAYIGYSSQTLPISNSFMTVYMNEDNMMLSEVVVQGLGSMKKKDMVMEKPVAKEVNRTDVPLATEQIENQTAVEFEIKTPYTIKSNNKNTMVEVDRYLLSADYEYYCIPKINKDAFLLANIVDWEKYNLLDGEANIFFENTFVGKTVLDVRNVSDTLNISLGRDKNISVMREKVKDLTSKKLLGTKREDTRAWKINVRNNKKQAVDFVLLDQIPVSTNSEIEVEAEKLSDGALNNETGEVKWKLKLQSAGKKELELRYKIKYPKNRTLTVE